MILITGGSGTLGQAFARLCYLRGLPYRLLTRDEMDIAETHSVTTALAAFQPWALVNCAGYVRVNSAEADRERCFRENASGPAVLAAACAERSIALLTFSSDLVFNGQKNGAYVESDSLDPLNVYGQSKAAAESEIARLYSDALVVRSSAFFSPWDEANFVTRTLAKLRAREVVIAADDLLVSPTYIPDLVHAALDLLIDRESGTWHLANQGQLTWADLARTAAQLHDLDEALVEGHPQSAFNAPAPRPRNSALSSERAELLPPLDDALMRYSRDGMKLVAKSGCGNVVRRVS
jgi:dTDP-4-dehydrorhamnose reductase